MYFLIVLFSSNNNYCSSPMRKGLAAPLRIEANDLVSIGKYASSDLVPPLIMQLYLFMWESFRPLNSLNVSLRF